MDALKILFTGGGTAGHVTPNIALIEASQSRGWSAFYVGSYAGIEREMIGTLDIPFMPVATGKLRRYFSWKNLLDLLRIPIGMLQSLLICIKEKPDLVFSKGGFVALPPVLAAWLCRIPIISHESDVTPGLANRLTRFACQKICTTFAETSQYLPAKKLVHTGAPLRSALHRRDAAAGFAHFGLEASRPLLLVLGGSLGARVINEQVRRVVPQLISRFNLVHIVGAGNIQKDALQKGYLQKRYVQREFIHAEFGDLLEAASLVVSRAGANILYELFVTRTPHLLIPLTAEVSRGDQLVNAATFQKRGFSRVLEEAALNDQTFLQAIDEVYLNRQGIKGALGEFEQKDSTALILDLFEQLVR